MTSRQERILIVDDEEIVRRLLRQRLMTEGYWCEEAANAEQALEKLEINPAELVILDIKMPGKSGIELLPEIQAGYPETAVIMVTAVTESNVIVQCMKEGADDYLCKPFDLDNATASVDRALAKRRLELEIKEYQQYLQLKVEEQTKEIRKLSLGAIEALVFALEAKDKYTAGHSRRVTKIATAIGEELSLSSGEIEDLRWAALLHDVGKIAVDQSVQNKPGKLTPEEYEHIMTHAHAGASIVKPVVNQQVVAMIEHHHDYYDGSGRVQLAVGDDIPLGARILAVADAFDAMVSDRPYRPPMPAEEAVEEIRRGSGNQFDPIVVEVFLKIPSAKTILVGVL